MNRADVRQQAVSHARNDANYAAHLFASSTSPCGPCSMPRDLKRKGKDRQVSVRCCHAIGCTPTSSKFKMNGRIAAAILHLHGQTLVDAMELTSNDSIYLEFQAGCGLRPA